MYQIDERLMADNRAIISVNSLKTNIDKILKSGMLNYVTNEHNDLYLTTPRSKNYGEYNRLIQEESDGKIPYDLVFKGNIIIEKNFSVLGEAATINAPNLTIEDNIIEINRNDTGDGITLGSAGIQANRGSKGNANWLFSENTDKLNVGAFIFDINGSVKAWIYEDGNFKTLNGFDTQDITARNDIYGMRNLTIDQNTLLKGLLTINGAATLNSTLSVTGGTTLKSSLDVTNATWLKSTLKVDGATTLNNTLNILGDNAAVLGGSLTTTGATLLKNTLKVNGVTDLDRTLNVLGATWLKDTLKVDKAATFNNTLTLLGDAIFNNPVEMKMTLHTIGAVDFDSTLNVDGITTLQNAVTIKGLSTIDGNNLHIKYDAVRGGGQLIVDKLADFNADVNIDNLLTVGGTLTVSGVTTLNNSLVVNAGTTLRGTLNTTGAATLQSLIVTGVTKLNSDLTAIGNIFIGDVNSSILKSDSNAIRIQTNSGYVDIGPKNTSLAHFATDRPSFYFSKPVKVQGEIYVGDSYNNKVWHEGNFDPSSKSNSNHVHSIVTTTVNGFMSAADKAKLDRIELGATNYVHPSTHPASMITGLPSSLPANGGNADTVDGKHAADFALASHSHSYAASSHTHNYAGSSSAGGAATTALACTGNAATATTATTANQIQGIACNKTATAPTGTTRLNIQAYLYATRVYNAVYNDYAEYFEKGEVTEPGDLVMIDIDSDEERYIKSDKAFSRDVIGVHSDSFGQCLGGKGDGKDDENYIPIGLAGRVYVKMIGSCKKGQFVVSSNMPGVAMAIDEKDYKFGTIIGKALEDCDGSKGIERVKILICKM